MSESKKLTTAAGDTQQGIKNLTDAEAEALIGKDREKPGLLFRLMTAAQKQVLFEKTARAMGDAPHEVKVRHIGNCTKADPAYGEGVARAMRIPLAEIPGAR